jgi:hypothetical protein
MNGGERNIEIFKPFGEAFEAMKKILFQPFDLKKWFVIGFAAWLSNLGGSGNYNFNYRNGDWKDLPIVQELRDTIHQIPHPLLVLILVVFVAVIFALIIVFTWLRARGRFMFVDCIVKNRGAIAEPWREYRKEGNSYFLFALIVGVIIAIIITAAAIPFLFSIIRSGTRPHWRDVYVLCTIVLWAAFLILLIFTWTLLSHFMVAVMYRRRCRALEAFRAAISLVANYPGEITLYCLFWIALAIAAGMASCVLLLATCCVAIIPYIGTVIMLPIFVCLRAFGLRFIRQFGPGYDVWASHVEAPPPAPSIPPPLPT